MKFVDIATKGDGFISVDAYMADLMEDDPANDWVTGCPITEGDYSGVAVRLHPWEIASKADWSWAHARTVLIYCDDIDRARSVWAAVKKFEPERMVLMCSTPAGHVVRDTMYPQNNQL